ncbi:MAG: hypothetical protein HZB64_09235 [Rhodocyclales bacterium]|nr:hypothetical protein [Rhodocyclales bacterium]
MEMEETRKPRWPVLVSLIFAMQAGAALSHGKPSSLEDDPCTRQAGGVMVHFNVYLPQHAVTANYCTEIPVAGEGVFVTDLASDELRYRPVAMRIVKGDDPNSIEQTIAYMPPGPHLDGVIASSANLEQGLYSAVITVEDSQPPVKFIYRLRVQMVDYVRYVVLTILLLLFSFLGYKLVRSQRFAALLAKFRR